MNPRARSLCPAVAVFTALGLVGGCADSSVSRDPAPSEAMKKLAVTHWGLAGTNSCAARACHGGLEPLGKSVQQDEFTTWVNRDKHADAYQTLLNERSAAIEKNLAGSGGKERKAYEDVRCLACHAIPWLADKEASSFVAQERTFGVGCEACHGKAEEWLGPHTTWGQKPAEEKKRLYQEHQMTWLGDMQSRAKVCAGCHVGAAASNGAPIRDVNHELIAAGHPRLNFEFAAYHANMPKHWREDRAPSSELEVWAVGQVVTAKAALELLSDRAKQHTRTWPEFAEYDCFACHHDLSAPSWRQTPAYYGNRPPGSYPWGTWYYSPALDKALSIQAGAVDLEGLRKLMRQPNPDRENAAHQAKTLADQFGKWLVQLDRERFSAEAAQKLARQLAVPNPKRVYEWDAEAQRYLALAAIVPGVQGGESPQPIRELGQKLHRAFPTKPYRYDSPRDYRPGEKSP